MTKGEAKTRRYIIIFGTALLFMMLIPLILNLVRIGGLKSREKALDGQIAAQNRQIAENAAELEYLSSQEYKDLAALKNGYVPDGYVMYEGG